MAKNGNGLKWTIAAIVAILLAVGSMVWRASGYEHSISDNTDDIAEMKPEVKKIPILEIQQKAIYEDVKWMREKMESE